MNGSNATLARLAKLLDELAVREGGNPTIVEGVEVFRISEPVPRHPVVYRPRLLVVGQGRKVGYLGDEVYHYDPFNYLVLSVPLPAESEAFASPEEPLLIVSIDLDPTMLGEMLLEMDGPGPSVETTPRGISSTPMTEAMGGAVVRLLESLRCPLDGRVLGPMAVREVIYRVLRGEQGGTLRALAARDDHFARIARVLRQVHVEFASPLTAEEMARRAGMSSSVFHHHFKLMTASSPIQYLKRIRLDHAKRLMAHDGQNASTAARAVGYESPSQFSREFKRLFGVTPVEEAERTRARLVPG
jgi:AraC-like DNA-binding protein